MDSIDFGDEVERPLSSSSNWSWDIVDSEGGARRVCSEELEISSDRLDLSREKVDPKETYPAKLHARSVAKQLGATNGLIYLPGIPQYSYEDSDNTVEFRQRRYFYYLSGINFPDCTVTYDLRFDKLYAWIQPPNPVRDVIYNGQNPTHEEVSNLADFDGVAYNTELEEYVVRFAENRSGKIFLTHNYDEPKGALFDAISLGREANDTSGALFDYTSLKPAMNAARAIKSPYEIRMIRKANEITAEAHTNVLKAIKGLGNEAEIEAIFLATCIKNQAKKQAYGAIAGSGENASTLHYVANNESLEGRQLVCLDAGCEWECYASDVTRSFPISGTFTSEAKEIYDLVAKMQEECIEMVKPGASYRDIHLHAHFVATEGLIDLKILKGNFEEVLKSGASMAFFPHGLGHYLGLEVHDVGEGGTLRWSTQSRPQKWVAAFDTLIQNPMLGAGSILQTNQVITIEPGIYFSRYALEKVYLNDDRFAKYINKDVLERFYPVGGVRIEDDILVTEEGYENLTTAPKGDEALRIINADELIVEEPRRKWLW